MSTVYSPLGDVEGQYQDHSKWEPTQNFARQAVRQGFIRKVLGLLAAQLVLTTLIGGSIVMSPAVKGFVVSNPWTFWMSFMGSFGIVIALGVSENLRRQHPTNLIMLFTFTAFESVLVGTASSMYDTELVVLAFGATAALVTGLALFALQSKVDVVSWAGGLFSGLLALIFASLMIAFLPAMPALHMALIVAGILIFSAWLIVDLQLLMGNSKLAFSPDEYVSATLNIYLDIINLFMYILRLLAELTRNNN